MNWRSHICIRILLLVARFVVDVPEIQDEIKALSTHISVRVPVVE